MVHDIERENGKKFYLLASEKREEIKAVGSYLTMAHRQNCRGCL